MKRIFTIVFIWMFLQSANGQIDYFLPRTDLPTVKQSSAVSPIRQETRITCRATNTVGSREVLVIIDGVPVELAIFEKLNPAEIASIDILRDDMIKALCDHSARGGVIIITTKSANICKLTIKDFLTGKPIPRATVCIINGNDSTKVSANDSGEVFIDRLKYSGYRVTVSSTGYNTATLAIDRKEKELLLERDVRLCDEVVITGYPTQHRHCYMGGTMSIIKEKRKDEEKVVNNMLAIYPNPVERSNRFNIEWVSNENGIGQLIVVNMSGTMVFSQPTRINEGLNQMSVMADSRWTAGIYNIQLRNENGTLVRREKIVVQ